MGKTFLFSPIGTTDPIKYFHDGSMLHIARVYQPDIVYLFLSKEMAANHKKDNRYVETLKLLGRKLKHTFEIKVIEREDLVDVQDYDTFYSEFREQIAEIESRMEEDDRLLLNMASGTPAMKSALLVLAAFAEYRFYPIQVSTPKKMANLEYEERAEYDVSANWELNEDNMEYFENRCKEIESMNFNWLLKENLIKKHLAAYDYHAAFTVGKELGKSLNKRTRVLLEIASERVKLNRERMEKLIPQCGYNFVYMCDTKEQKLFEYVLGLKVKVQREDYADFLRGLTPAVVDLMEIVLRKRCKIRVSDYCTTQNGQIMWDKNKMKNTKVEESLNRRYPNGFRGGSVYSHHLNTLIQSFCDDLELCKKSNEINAVEVKARNLAAHNIVSVTAYWIKQRTGKTPQEIMDILIYLCDKAGVTPEPKAWDSYEEMNQIIIKELEQN